MSSSPPAALTAQHDTSDFNCGETVLDDWLRHRALTNEGRNARTYVVSDGGRVVAYYCISAGGLDRAAVPGKLRRNAPDLIPISVIGRLAVDKAVAGRGLGAALVRDALRRVFAASQTIGIRAVLVQAKDEHVKRFYLGCAEFIEFPAESRTLFLPIETVVAGFAIAQT